MDASGPVSIIEWLSIPEMPGVYGFPTHARVVTLAAQQTRAFNLVWALKHAGRLKDGSAVLVVGGGVAGVTAAAAARAVGATVTLAERVQSILHLQKHNRLRYVHPNVLEWPKEESSNSGTSFPFMNWTAGVVGDVIGQLSMEWDQLQMARPVQLLLSTEVVGLDSDGMRYRARFRDAESGKDVLSEQLYDIVILAVGFGSEINLPDRRRDSYWHNDALDSWHQGAHALVSGCGDGGLTDVLRLRIHSFDHARFVEMMQLHASELRGPLQSAEARVFVKLEERIIDESSVGKEFEREYEAVMNALPESVQSDLQSIILTQSRNDISVTLNDKRSSPFSIHASTLNRYAVFLLKKYGRISFRSADIGWTRADDGYEVTFGPADPVVFQILVVRHGPDRTMMHPFIPEAVRLELADRWRAAQDPSLVSAWPTEFFGADHSSTRVDRYHYPRREASQEFWFSANSDALLAAVARILILSGARILDRSRLKFGPDSPASWPDLGMIRDGKLYLIDVYSFQTRITKQQVAHFYSGFRRVADLYAATAWRDFPQLGREERLALEAAPQALLIALRGFTPEALRLAQDHGILLWTAAELETLAREGGVALTGFLSNSVPLDE